MLLDRIKSKAIRFGIGIAGVILVELADFLTGHDMAFSIFYLFTVMYFAWYVGFASAILMAFVCAALSVFTDYFSGFQYPHSIIPFWAFVMRVATFWIVVIVLSRLKRTGAELRETIEALKQSNRNLDAFTGTVSHDLQTPLATVEMFGELLETKLSPADKDAKEYLGYMRTAAKRMQGLIRELLNFTRLSGSGRLPFQKIDLAVILNTLLQDMKALILEKKAEIQVSGLPAVKGNAVQMHQLFLNLISNALKYSREGVAPRVQIEGKMEHGCVIITVADNGKGFDPREDERVFEPFYRVQGDIEGTGLGLAICRKIMTEHGGEITAHGTPDSGATFILRFPEPSNLLDS